VRGFGQISEAPWYPTFYFVRSEILSASDESTVTGRYCRTASTKPLESPASKTPLMR
jgi:hypothetical protein